MSARGELACHQLVLRLLERESVTEEPLCQGDEVLDFLQWERAGHVDRAHQRVHLVALPLRARAHHPPNPRLHLRLEILQPMHLARQPALASPTHEPNLLLPQRLVLRGGEGREGPPYQPQTLSPRVGLGQCGEEELVKPHSEREDFGLKRRGEFFQLLGGEGDRLAEEGEAGGGEVERLAVPPEALGGTEEEGAVGCFAGVEHSEREVLEGLRGEGKERGASRRSDES